MVSHHHEPHEPHAPQAGAPAASTPSPQAPSWGTVSLSVSLKYLYSCHTGPEVLALER